MKNLFISKNTVESFIQGNRIPRLSNQYLYQLGLISGLCIWMSVWSFSQNIIIDGAVHTLNHPGNYSDYLIPNDAPNTKITFQVKGGDGGNTVFGTTSRASGGIGATVQATFAVGSGGIPQGSTIRFVQGEKGETGIISGNAGLTYGGGGGGSAVLYQAPGSTEWNLLVVAGGGGGAFLYVKNPQSMSSGSGQGGRTGTEGGYSSGASGKGGGGGGSYGGGGGGASGDGAGFICSGTTVGGGEKGGDSIGAGGQITGCSTSGAYNTAGGAGYGGGGAGHSAESESAMTGGGGGGGYSGGGFGGGGGSFVASMALSESKTAGGSTGSPKDGTVSYEAEEILTPQARCKDVSLYLDASGKATLRVADIDNGSEARQGTLVFKEVSQTEFTCTSIASSVSVSLVVTDSQGNKDSCTAEVTVLDTLPPVVRTRDVTVYLDADGKGTIAAADIDNGSADNCGISDLLLSKAEFACADIGSQSVMLTVKDGHGNEASGTAEVTVSDTLSPVVKTRDVTVYLDADGKGTIVADDIDNGSADNCGISDLLLSKAEFACADIGSQSVMLTVKDGHGNEASGTAEVTVSDTLSPVVKTRDVTVYLDADGKGTIAAADIDNGSADNCGISDLSLSKAEFTCADIGSQSVMLTVKDGHGNEASGTAEVTVLNTLPPVVKTRDVTVFLNKFGRAKVEVDMIEDGSWDNCGIVSFRLEGKTEYGCEDLGDHRLKLYASDENGNESFQYATVHVKSYEADFSNQQGISEGDTVFLVSCQAPWTELEIGFENEKEMKKHGILRSFMSRGPLPSDVPWGMYEIWRYNYEFEDPCGHIETFRFYLALYDIDPPLIQRFPGDITIPTIQDLPEPDKGVKLVDVCQYVVWDTVMTMPVIDFTTGDTTAFTRRWIAVDPSGHQSFQDQMIWIGQKRQTGKITGRIAAEESMISSKLPGEAGNNDISLSLYYIDPDMESPSPVKTNMQTTGNLNGAQGTFYFGPVMPGRYQVKIDSLLCLADSLVFDDQLWSDTLTVKGGTTLDLGMVITQGCPSEIVVPDTSMISEQEKIVAGQLGGKTETGWILYPNPTTGYVHIRTDTDIPLEYRLYDGLGRYIRSGVAANGQGIDLRRLRSGVYHFLLEDKEGILGVQRLMIAE